MNKTTTLTVRLSGSLQDHVAEATGEYGTYENVSEYIRALIRQDKECVEQKAFEHLKAELQHAFAAPEESYVSLQAADVIARNE